MLNALSSIGDAHLRRAFYSKLKNPNWLGPLARAGVFENVAFGDKLESSKTDWPEGLYLNNIARDKPDEVSEVLLGLADSKNSGFRRQCIEITASLPPRQAAKVARVASGWANDDIELERNVFCTDALLTLIDNLIQADGKKEFAAGSELARQCFMPRREAGPEDVSALVWGYDYREYLTRAYEHVGFSGKYHAVREFIIKALDILGSDGDGRVSSAFVVPSVAEECASEDDSTLGILSDIFVGLVKEAVVADSEFGLADNAVNDSVPYIQRLGLYALQRFLEEGDFRGHAHGELLKSLVRGAVLSDRLYDGEFDCELYPLAASALAHGIVSPEEITAAAVEGFERIQDEYVELVAESELLNPEDPGSYAAERARYWQHRFLPTFGPDNLDAEGKRLYGRLCDEFGELTYDLRPYITTTWVGPNSPLTQDELLALGPMGLVDYLRTWHPSKGDGRSLISHEGLGRAVTALVKDEPAVFAGLGSSLISLRPTYQRSIVEGWDQALGDGKEIPLADFLAVASSAAGIPDDEPFDNEGSAIDDDPDYQRLKRECARLLSDTVQKVENISAADKSGIINALIKFTHSNEPDKAFEDGFGDNNASPLTIAINTVRPLAIGGVCAWISRFPDDEQVGNALATLGNCLPDRRDTLSDAAAFGESLPKLQRAVPTWVDDNYASLFGKEKANVGQQVVLTTVLSLYWPNRHLLDFLRPAMSLAIENDAEHYELGFERRTARTCDLMIGDWLYRGLACGYVRGEDELLVKWRGPADAETLGSVLQHICWLVERSADVPGNIVKHVFFET